MKCRHCKTDLSYLLIDLGAQPPSNSYLKREDLDKGELNYPLKVYVCQKCFLVQTADFIRRETFFNSDYAYFSSTSSGWLEHAKKYVQEMTNMFDIGEKSFVIEIASNDGYLLKNFIDKNIPCLGVEPTESTAAVSKALGINTLVEFYSVQIAKMILAKYGSADLITCNNVYAHVPDINDFTRALQISLSDEGVVTIEFPHLLQLVSHCQFDTIYHEHYSYLSVQTVKNIFASQNLRLFKVEELSTHGGSVRVFGCKSSASHKTCDSVDGIIKKEREQGLFDVSTYSIFYERSINIKLSSLDFLMKAKKEGKVVCGYGAAAKGNTFLNFAGIKSDLLPVVGDAAASKIGKFLPGSRIPIVGPEVVYDINPDYIIVLPWNIAEEVKSQFPKLVNRGCKFMTFIPEEREV